MLDILTPNAARVILPSVKPPLSSLPIIVCCLFFIFHTQVSGWGGRWGEPPFISVTALFTSAGDLPRTCAPRRTVGCQTAQYATGPRALATASISDPQHTHTHTQAGIQKQTDWWWLGQETAEMLTILEIWQARLDKAEHNVPLWRRTKVYMCVCVCVSFILPFFLHLRSSTPLLPPLFLCSAKQR